MRRWSSLLNAVVLCATCCAAQQELELADIASRSGIIFRGTVLAVVPEDARAPGEIPVTRVSFRVDDGVRGTTTGESLTIRQWNVEADEYRVGEELVLFLYSPSDQLGLTSTVGGRAGHLRVENVSIAELNTFRAAVKPANTAPATNTQAPSRPARGSAK